MSDKCFVRIFVSPVFIAGCNQHKFLLLLEKQQGLLEIPSRWLHGGRKRRTWRFFFSAVRF
jgi:hypothetical protein